MIYLILLTTKLWASDLSSELTQEFMNKLLLNPTISVLDTPRYYEDNQLCLDKLEETDKLLGHLNDDEILAPGLALIKKQLHELSQTKSPGCIIYKIILKEMIMNNDVKSFNCESLMLDHLRQRELTKSKQLPLCIEHLIDLYTKGSK